MKKQGILSFIFALFIIITAPAAVYAEEPELAADPGITPDSPWYFAKTAMQQLNLVFTFNEEARAMKALSFAEEHLAEMVAMAQQNRARAMKQAADEYHNSLTIATRNMQESMNKGTGTSLKIAERMSLHIASSYRNAGTPNKDSEQLMIQAREAAENCQENAVRALGSQDSEEALMLNLRFMQQQVNRINSVDSSEAGQALQQYERLRTMNREIIALAVLAGKGNEAQLTADRETANMEKAMATIRNEVQNRNQNSTTSTAQPVNDSQPANQQQSSNQNTGSTSGGNSPTSTGTSAGSSTSPGMGGTGSTGGSTGGQSGKGK